MASTLKFAKVAPPISGSLVNPPSIAKTEAAPRCPLTVNCWVKFAAPLVSVIVPAASSNNLLKSRSFSGIVGGIGGSGCGGNGRGDARLRYRRIDSPAGVVLWRGRFEADLWTRVALWADCVCFVARSHRAVCENRQGSRAGVAHDCGPRSHGFDFRRGARARLCGGT